MLWNCLVLFPLHGTIYLISRSLLPTHGCCLVRQRDTEFHWTDIHGYLLSNFFLPLSYRTILITRIHLSFMYENYHLYRNIHTQIHIYICVWGNQEVLYKLITQNILIGYPKKDHKSLINIATNNLEKEIHVSWYYRVTEC